MFAADETLVRYRIPSVDALRQPGREARAMFGRELREAERRRSPRTHLILQILAHFVPRHLRNLPNTRDPAYEAAAIPVKMQNFAVAEKAFLRFPENFPDFAT